MAENQEYHRPPTPKTEIPQAEKTPESSAKRTKERSAVSEKLTSVIGWRESPKMFDDVRAKFKSDYDACAFFVVSLAKHVPPEDQGEYYVVLRSVLSCHPRAKEIGYQLALAWADFHYQEEPSRLLMILRDVMGDQKLPPGNQRLSLVLSMLHSGYTSRDSEKKLKTMAGEILKRRSEFQKREIAGQGIAIISLEDSDSFSPRGFLRQAEKLGSPVTVLNETTTSNLEKSFCENIKKSDPNTPLTLILTVHGMAQENGYLDLPHDQKLRADELAEALIQRGNAKNVTILTTQCLPRSSRRKDSFMDNVREACVRAGIGVPSVYMESTQDQSAILNPKTNPDFDSFQTLRIVAAQKTSRPNITGKDILDASTEVLGNQPSLMLPPGETGGVPLNNDIALNEKTMPNDLLFT